MWKRNPNKKEREKPNRLKLKPTIGFRSNLSPLVLGYLKKLSTNKAKSDFINQAIEQRFFLLTNKRQFIKNILKENYNLCRFLLRKIGNEN